MRMKRFLVFLLLFCSFAGAVSAEEKYIDCNRKSFTYNEDGTVTVNTWRGDETYDSAEEAYIAVYGFVPSLKISDSELNGLFQSANEQNSSSSNSNGRIKKIYTVEEATRLSKPTGNRFMVRYK